MNEKNQELDDKKIQLKLKYQTLLDNDKPHLAIKELLNILPIKKEKYDEIINEINEINELD